MYSIRYTLTKTQIFKKFPSGKTNDRKKCPLVLFVSSNFALLIYDSYMS